MHQFRQFLCICSRIPMYSFLPLQMRAYSSSTPTSPHITEKRAFKEAEQKRNSLESDYIDRKHNRNRSSSSKTGISRSSSLSLLIFPLITEVSFQFGCTKGTLRSTKYNYRMPGSNSISQKSYFPKEAF